LKNGKNNLRLTMSKIQEVDIRKVIKIKMTKEYNNCLVKPTFRKLGQKLEFFKNNPNLRDAFVNYWEQKYWSDLKAMDKLNIYQVSTYLFL
jgi:hypothetical protein